jgi:hypothetical protein
MPPMRSFRVLICTLLALCAVLSTRLSRADRQPVSSDLAVHEWGTFTSIAGNEGQAVKWLPLTGSTDLPSFVEHFRDVGFKIGLSGTVRMETPVIYFYAPRQMTVSVKVGFSKGVITEWYPHASRVEPTAMLMDSSLYEKNANDGSVAWDSIKLDPNSKADLPREDRDNRYYAARETSATHLRVSASTGEQQEKFLFYRGVSTFPVPISAKLTPNDGKLAVRNLSEQTIPNMILFERRGSKLGYRIVGPLQSDVQNEVTLGPPDLTGEQASLDKDLEGMLVVQGLNPDEARAMVKTWRDSWFEEGSRLMYIVPRQFVDAILPLSINPAPARTVRVFVGRLELVTPATEKAVEAAFESHDDITLAKYGRFLEPILTQMIQETSDNNRQKRLRSYLDSASASQAKERFARNGQ